jgi:hypothetical protein
MSMSLHSHIYVDCFYAQRGLISPDEGLLEKWRAGAIQKCEMKDQQSSARSGGVMLQIVLNNNKNNNIQGKEMLPGIDNPGKHSLRPFYSNIMSCQPTAGSCRSINLTQPFP